jgi:hypothetical protein
MDSVWIYKFIMDNNHLAYDEATKIGYVYHAAAGAAHITGEPTGYSRNNKPKVIFISYVDPNLTAANCNKISIPIVFTSGVLGRSNPARST